MEDFDRLTDEQIADNGKQIAQKRLRQAIKEIAEWKAPVNDVYGSWADGYAKLLAKQITWMWDDGHPSRRARKWLNKVLGDQSLWHLLGEDWEETMRQAYQ